MNALRRVGVSIFVVLGLVLAPAVTQAGAASFNPTPGEYFVDTGTLELIGPGPTLVATGVNEGGIAVFAFDSIAIPVGAEIFAEGPLPLELRSGGDFTLNGLIEASGFDAIRETAGPNPGGPGGGAGGANGSQAGSGPGGGGVGSAEENGSGGGGFGGDGADGGAGSGTGGAGGSAYGDLDVALQGGSGGGGGTLTFTPVGGGGGGGAVKLSAPSLTIGAGGAVFAEGGDGNGGNFGASGGGSGGGIFLNAGRLDVAGIVSADGGDGGTGGCCGDGGGGGGGRIAYKYGNLLNGGEPSVAGGESGASGPFGHGNLSPQATGASGVITKTQGPSSTTFPAGGVGITEATLNGIVNPHGQATTYHFELGTTAAYGTTVPVPDVAVGSDSSEHSVSQGVSGLAPSTTYHYRIVATGFGLVIPGADMTFTTAPKPEAKCDGVKIAPGRVKVKKGKAPIQLSSTGACKGSLALFMKAPPKGKGSASKKGKGKGGKSIQIGSASFSLDAGQTKTVEVTLSAAALKRLKSGKALPATAKATTTDDAGLKKTTQANVSLKLAKKGKGPKKRP